MTLISKIGVPYEPLRKNRFLFRWVDTSLGIQEYWMASASRPSITINAVEIPFLNTSVYISGRFNWEPITVTLNDPIGPSATQAVMEWVRLHAESITGRMGYKAGYAKAVEIEMLDPTGVVVQKWLLENTIIESADFGDLSMDDDGLAQITLSLRFDRAISVF
jgi:hypothetical protein